jgi:hypothetical protein
VTTPQPGDIGFAHNRGIMGKLIRVGEWLQLRNSEWNHAFVVSRVVDGVPFIIQATLKGVIESPLRTVAPGGSEITFAPPAGVDRDKVVAFAQSQLGNEYGVLTIAAIAIDIVSWNWVPSLRGARKQSWICSGLTCEALRFGGWLHDWIDIYDVTPQQAFDVLAIGGDFKDEGSPST